MTGGLVMNGARHTDPGATQPFLPMTGEPVSDAPVGTNTALAGLEARSISAWFGSHKVLERLSLSMRPGGVTALVGPSDPRTADYVGGTRTCARGRPRPRMRPARRLTG